MAEQFNPKPENLGKNCVFWGGANGCRYPKFEVTSRKSCEGVIDDICLWRIGAGKRPVGISEDLIKTFKTTIPNAADLPPGEIDPDGPDFPPFSNRND